MYLIYINQVGETYKGKYLYEFLFSDTIKNIDGDDWDTFPASGRPSPPNETFVKKVGRLESELKLEVVQMVYHFQQVFLLGQQGLLDFQLRNPKNR